jgi:hypothetical protein
MAPVIEEFEPDDARLAEFEAIRERIYGAAVPEAVLPGARCYLARQGGEPVAGLSADVADELQGVAGRCGLIGHYEAVDAGAGIALLRRAQERLARAGCRRVLGPMNGSTWARYRLALPAQPGDPVFDPPVFFTEPQNPPEYSGHFLAAGFTAAARYESRIVTDLAAARPRARALAERVAASGITVRPLDVERLDEEIQALFAFSETAFGGNLYYRPVAFRTFHAMYARLRGIIDPDLVRLAFNRAGRLVAFVFALPDILSQAEGRPTRVVLKTLATAPDARSLGLSACLTDEIHRLAQAKAYRAVIHALMHTGNDSLRVSQRYPGQVFRRYALYEWVSGLVRWPVCQLVNWSIG